MTTFEIPAFPKESNRKEPTIVMFHRWFLESRRAIIDLLWMTGVGGTLFLVLITHDFTETFFEYTRALEHLQLDEVLFTLIFILAVILPIFAIRRWQDAIKFLQDSNTDSLTHLANRRKGWSLLHEEIARAKRYRVPLSIILFDIDHFKKVNDEFGHLKGDSLLENLAKAMKSKMRLHDTLIRWGGEEFLVILSDTDLEGAHRMAERLRACAESECDYGVNRVTVSLGIAEWGQAKAAQDLIKEADDRMYEAKAAGRNRVFP